MEQLPRHELMTAEQWVAKLISKVNEIVVAVNEIKYEKRTISEIKNAAKDMILDVMLDPGEHEEIERLKKENEGLKKDNKILYDQYMTLLQKVKNLSQDLHDLSEE